MTRRLRVGLVVTLMLAAPRGMAREDPSVHLSFESGSFAAWKGEPHGPSGTAFIDSVTVHGGRYAARLEREARSASTFSSIAFTLPADMAGDSLEVRGWLRLEGVAGQAGLWQRQDGVSGVVQFDNMMDRGLSGTQEWREVRVVLPLDRRARQIICGALLVGTGKVWADDLQIRVDGKPLADAPASTRPANPLETDHAFDASSGIASMRPTRAQLENLELLGKVWGFLKYHHPRVMRGERHWDYELFRVAPKVLAARSRADVQRVFLNWLDALGPVPACANCAPNPAGRPIVPKLEWLANESRLGRDLARRLRLVHAHRDSTHEQFFVSLVPGVGNPVFLNEPDYAAQASPDAGYRLLALFRLWNIVEYWFPYRDLLEEDWDQTLREFIPRFLEASSRDAYILELFRLSARLHDGHANLWRALSVRPPVGPCQAAVALRMVEGRPIVGGYAHAALGPASGLEVGDLIQTVQGEPFDALFARWRPMYAASNDDTRARDMARALTRGPCDTLRLGIVRDGREQVVHVPRIPSDSIAERAGRTHDRPGEAFRRVSDDLAYLKLSAVKAREAPDYIRKSAGAKCLLIDIRNYPSEFVVFALGSHLVPKRTEFARFTVGDLANPGSFRWTDPVALEPAEPRFEGRVAILVDEQSISQSEYTAMAFRAAPEAVVVGSTTAGADGNVSSIPLPGGLSGLMSGIGVFYPDRRPTQRIGIVPDVVARPTVAGIRAGRDEVIEAAVRHVLRRELSASERAALGL